MSKTLIELWDDFFDDNNELKEQYILNDLSSCKAEFHSLLEENSLQFNNIPEKNHLLQEKSFKNYVKILVFLEKNLNQQSPSWIKSKAFALTMIFNNLDELKGYFNRYYEEPKKNLTPSNLLFNATYIPILNKSTYNAACDVALWQTILKNNFNSEKSVFFRIIPYAGGIQHLIKDTKKIKKDILKDLSQWTSDLIYAPHNTPLGEPIDRLLFFKNDIQLSAFEDWLSLKKASVNDDTLIPTIDIKTNIIDINRHYTLKKLDAKDPLNALIGCYTSCCHHIDNIEGGQTITQNVCQDASSGIYVLFNNTGTPVAKTIAYRAKDDTIIFNQVQINSIEKARATAFYERVFAYLACYLSSHHNVKKISQGKEGLILGEKEEYDKITSVNGVNYYDSKNHRYILISNGAWLNLAITYDLFNLFFTKSEDVNPYHSSIHLCDSFGMFPLHVAASLGKLEVAEELLRLGASFNVMNDDNETPLHLAAKNGHFDMCKLLISQGAELFCKNSSETPITPFEILLTHENLTKNIFDDIFKNFKQEDLKKAIFEQSFHHKVSLLLDILSNENMFTRDLIVSWIDIDNLVNNEGKTLGHLCFESDLLSNFLIQHHQDLFNKKDLDNKNSLDHYLELSISEIDPIFLEKLINITEYIDTNRLIATLTKYLDDIKSRYYKDSNNIDTLNRLIERFSLLHKPEQATSHSLLHQHSIFQPTSHDRKEIISEEAHEEGHAPKNN